MVRLNPLGLALSVPHYRLLLMLWAAMLAAAPSLAQQAGKRVAEVLESLGAQGIEFIYTTALVPDDMLVRSEPVAQDGLQLAQEILAQHRLQILRVAPGTYAVVRGRAPSPSQDAAQDTERDAPRGEVEEIIVSTSRYALASENVQANTLLTQQDVSALPKLGDETLKAVQRLPGAATNGISGLAAIRGGEPNETLILLDGVQLFEPFHLKNFFSPVSLLDSRMISEMDVHAGGFPASFGGRISAVLDARSVKPQADRYYELGASLFHTNVLASHRFAKQRGQWLVSGRRSNLDQIAEALDWDFGEPRYFDAFSRLDYELSPATRVSANYLGSRDKVQAQRSSRAESSRNEYRNNYGWLSLDHEWSSTAAVRIVGSFTDVTNERSGRVDRQNEIVGVVDDERAFHIAGLQIDGRYETAHFMHKWGASAKRLSATYDYATDVRFQAGYPFPDSPASQTQWTTRLRPSGDEYSAYWSARMQLFSKLTTELGLRWDDETYTGMDDTNQLAPRISAMYLLPAGERLRFSWGRFYQSQAINEAIVENASTYFYPPQRADQFIVSYESDAFVGMQLRIEAYLKDYDRLRPRWENLFDPIVLAPELEYDRIFIDPDRARAEGIEILLSSRSGPRWQWWLGYTWSQVKDVIEGREFSRSWDQRHAVTAGLHWRHARWDVTLAHTYHTGWPTTPVSVVGTGAQARIVIGERNSVRLDDFNSFDLRINRSFELPRGELDVFLEVSNFFNESNACCIEPVVSRSSSGMLELDQDTTYWLGRVPSIGVLWRY